MTLRDQALQFLIATQWIDGEAADDGVSLSSAELQRAIAVAQRRAAPKPGGFTNYLATSGLTAQDFALRVHTDALWAKLVAKVTANVPSRQRAYQQFVPRFQRKWRLRTECASGYVIPGCRNAPARAQPATSGSGG